MGTNYYKPKASTSDRPTETHGAVGPSLAALGAVGDFFAGTPGLFTSAGAAGGSAIDGAAAGAVADWDNQQAIIQRQKNERKKRVAEALEAQSALSQQHSADRPATQADISRAIAAEAPRFRFSDTEKSGYIRRRNEAI